MEHELRDGLSPVRVRPDQVELINTSLLTIDELKRRPEHLDIHAVDVGVVVSHSLTLIIA
tara:strand:+ start:271 stop:450 length:180 start_codon:yes stop_codon:yes gene_type:complete